MPGRRPVLDRRPRLHHPSCLRVTPLNSRDCPPLRVGVQLPEVEARCAGRSSSRSRARPSKNVRSSGFWRPPALSRDGRPERGPWDAWTTLAGLAVATQRVTIGPLVACTAFHEPGLLARRAAAVDGLRAAGSSSRSGSGWNETSFAPSGSRRAEGRALRGGLRHCPACSPGNASPSRGGSTGSRTPARRRRARPPLMVGANGPRMLAATLPHVDAWNTWYTATTRPEASGS